MCDTPVEGCRVMPFVIKKTFWHVLHVLERYVYRYRRRPGCLNSLPYIVPLFHLSIGTKRNFNSSSCQ